MFSLAHPGPPDTGWDIYVLPLGAERKAYPFLQTRFDEHSARLARRRWVAYQSDDSGRFEVFVRPFPGPGAKWQLSAEGGSQPHWSRDGEQSSSYRNEGKMMVVEVEAEPAFHAGRPQMLSKVIF